MYISTEEEWTLVFKYTVGRLVSVYTQQNVGTVHGIITEDRGIGLERTAKSPSILYNHVLPY